MTHKAFANRAPQPTGYSVNAKKAKDEAEIILYDEIGESFWGGGVSAKRFIDGLNAIEAKTIHVRINSPGGSVFDGSAMYNALVRHDSKIITHADGLAASAASLVFMAGSTRNMAENAFLMVHNPWGLAMGDLAEMRKTADQLDGIQTVMAKTYADASGADLSQITAWMDEETWMDSTFAHEHGFVHEITENLKVAASIDTRRFKFAHLPAALTKPAAEQAEETDKLIRLQLDRMRSRVLTRTK